MEKRFGIEKLNTYKKFAKNVQNSKRLLSKYSKKLKIKEIS